MLTFQRIRLSKFDRQNEIFQRLHEIFSKTLKTSMSYKEFSVYYFYHKPHFMDITFILDGSETVGFISATFYKHQLRGQDHTICRGALGVLAQYRRGVLTGWQLCLKYITYKICNPSEKVFVTGFITNPIMYSMICKYAHNVYPKQGIKIPAEIYQLKDELIALLKLQKKEIAPFVVNLHFHVPVNEFQLKRIYSSCDKDVLFYRSMNDNFQEHAGVLTIIPVNWKNVSASVVKVLITRPLNKFIQKLSFPIIVPDFVKARNFRPKPSPGKNHKAIGTA